MLIVQKFGGSSLADLQRLRRAAGIAAEARRRENQVVLVVSAAGNSTDELLSLARRILPHPPRRELDALMATGEQRSAALMAMMLESLGCPARSFSGARAGIHTDGNHGKPPSSGWSRRPCAGAWRPGRSPLWRASRAARARER